MKPNRIGRKDVIARVFSEAIPGAEIASEKTLAMTDGREFSLRSQDVRFHPLVTIILAGNDETCNPLYITGRRQEMASISVF